MSRFVVALLKGAMEGDMWKHFGAIAGARPHRHDAYAAGLTQPGPVYDDVPTDAGRDFYARHQLEQLPDGRAYLAWNDRDPVFRAALDEAAALLADKKSRGRESGTG